MINMLRTEEKSNETSMKHGYFIFKLPIFPVYVHRFEKQNAFGMGTQL